MDFHHPQNDPGPTNILFISLVKIIYQLQQTHWNEPAIQEYINIFFNTHIYSINLTRYKVPTCCWPTLPTSASQQHNNSTWHARNHSQPRSTMATSRQGREKSSIIYELKYVEMITTGFLAWGIWKIRSPRYTLSQGRGKKHICQTIKSQEIFRFLKILVTQVYNPSQTVL